MTTRSDLLIPEILEDAIPGAFRGMSVLFGSDAAVVNNTLPNESRGGDLVRIPYFNTLGELEDVPEGRPLLPAKLTMTEEQAHVQHSGKAFEITQWAQMAAVYADPYAEGVRQIREMTSRRAEKALQDAASLPNPRMTLNVYNAARPRLLDYDLTVDAKMKWGDEQDDIALVMVHSKVMGDLLKLKDAENRPLLTNVTDAGLKRFVGMPLMVSDRMPVEFPLVGAGTDPPALVVTGSPAGDFVLAIEVVTAGPLGTARLRYSIDGATSWEQPVLTTPSVQLGDTGLTLELPPNANFGADNAWRAVPRYTTTVLKKRSLVFWFTGAPPVQTDRDVLMDSHLAAVHVYWVAHRYARLPNSTRGGVVLIKHN